MRIAELSGIMKDEDVVIVGTGPSMRLFDMRVLSGRPKIGLNQSWHYGRMDFSVTAHPELVAEYLADPTARDKPTKWVVKQKGPFASVSLDDPRHYFFKTEENWNLFQMPKPDHLFIGRGIQQTAMHLALLMGVRSITLVGVDMAVLEGDHHGHAQHVRYHGQSADLVMNEYYAWTSEARDRLRSKGIPVYTLTPFVGLTRVKEDYIHMRDRLGLKSLPAPPDTSGYKRPGVDLDPKNPRKK